MARTEKNWPVLFPGSKMIRPVRIPTETNRSIVMPLRWGTPALLLPHLIMCFDDRVQDVDGAIGSVRDDWGYAFRAVRGYSAIFSDHAGGIAVDVNATKHPLGKRGTFTNAQKREIEEIIRLPRYCYNGDPVFYWGGHYHRRGDEMHFGLRLPLFKAEVVARRLLTSPRGLEICKANKGLKEYVLS